MNEEKLFHIGIAREQGAAYAILPGDPARVPLIARYLEDPAPGCPDRYLRRYERGGDTRRPGDSYRCRSYGGNLQGICTVGISRSGGF